MAQICRDCARIADDDVWMMLPDFRIKVVKKVPDHRVVKGDDIFLRIAFDKTYIAEDIGQKQARVGDVLEIRHKFAADQFETELSVFLYQRQQMLDKTEALFKIQVYFVVIKIQFPGYGEIVERGFVQHNLDGRFFQDPACETVDALQFRDIDLPVAGRVCFHEYLVEQVIRKKMLRHMTEKPAQFCGKNRLDIVIVFQHVLHGNSVKDQSLTVEHGFQTMV